MSEKIVLILLIFKNIWGFNVDTNFPIVYKDPSGKEESRSYFGYSVVIYPGSLNNPEKWIKIGAPQENDTSEVDSSELGVVYSCPMNNVYSGCSTIQFPKAELNSSTKVEIRKDHWIGGTMDISYEYDRMVICGFRRRFQQPRQIKGQIERDYRTIGGCYYSTLNNSAFEDIAEIRDLFLLKGISSATTGQPLYYYGQGEAGFSAHFSTGQNEFILGAPGIYDYSGGVLKVHEDLTNLEPISRKRKRSLNQFTFTYEISPQNYSTSSHYDLLGYSVTSGYFYGNNEIYYAVGSPKGVIGTESFYEEKLEERLLFKDQKKGKVLLFKFDRDTLLRKERLLGDQYGAYFGSSLTAGRVNKDSYDDLIVGAPFSKENTYNEGRVYLYLGDKDNLIKSTVLKGRVPNGQFGTAVMYLDDLDHNRYGEVAVSAPYEDDNGGVVYIFKGQDNGLHAIPYQKIVGKQILYNIRGFGMSISRSADMDDNKFKDFAVGAPLSGHVVYLRTRPVVVVTSELEIPNALENKEQNFTLRACFNFTEYEGESINISFEVNVDILSYFQALNNFTVIKNSTSCEDFIVSLELKNNFLSETSFVARLSYFLLESPSKKNVTIISSKADEMHDYFCNTCPVLDKFRSSPLETQVKINIVLECGDDKYCESNLIVNANIPEVRKNNTFVVGSSKYLTLEVEIKNIGENAYGTNLNVLLPNGLQFTDNLNGKCTVGLNKSTIICHVDNPLKQNATKLIILHVDMDNIYDYNYYSNQLLFIFNATTVSNDTKTGNIFNYIVQLKHADILLFGWSEPDDGYYANVEKNELIELTHTFKVGKTGYSPLKKLVFKVDIPYLFTISNKQITFVKLHAPSSHFKNLPMVCTGDFDKEEQDVKTAALTNDKSLGIFPLFQRKKRSTVLTKYNENTIKVSNSTLYLNCSMDLVTCAHIECSFGPFEDERDSAEIDVKITFNVSALSELSNAYDMMLISTDGKIDILSPKFFKQINNSTSKVVSTPLRKIEQTNVAFWIILLAIALGLLLLIIIIIGLIKMGFFKRKVKEEMDLLKSEKENNGKPKNEIVDITDDQELMPEDSSDDKLDSNEETDDKELEQNTTSSREGLIDTTDDQP